MTKRQKKIFSYTMGGIVLLGITAYFFYGLGQNRSDIEKTKQSLGIASQKETIVKQETASKTTLDSSGATSLYTTGSENTALSKDFFASLPTASSFGNPVDLGDEKFTYSDLKGLEISRLNVSSSGGVNCDNITDFLSNTLSGYYWWNTCRPFGSTSQEKGGSGVSFFVVRLSDDGTEYIYEKHYVLFVKGWYGKYEIKRVIPVDKANIDADIRAQSNILKTMNFDALPLNIVDDLFLKLNF